MEPLEETAVRPRQVRYQAALRPDIERLGVLTANRPPRQRSPTGLLGKPGNFDGGVRRSESVTIKQVSTRPESGHRSRRLHHMTSFLAFVVRM